MAVVGLALASVDITAEQASRPPGNAPRPRPAGTSGQSGERARPAAPNRLECGTPLAFQVLLDRRGFSPGELDGRLGPNAKRAIAEFQQSTGQPATGVPDCTTWQALGGDSSEITTVYHITEADAQGPFVDTIPPDLLEQSKLPALGYRSMTERLAERFHASPALLTQLNRRASFAAGNDIEVPAVQPFDPSMKPAPAGPAATVTVEVSREGSLKVLRPDGGIEFFAPITSGSEHDPLPAGNWKVTGVQWMPPFHYNPALFWDANPTHTSAKIAPGPNNPVGVVWIDVNVEHYGLHGSPEPGRIGHTESHGCVRLTNWDAARLASLVKIGTPVVFK
jgi:lipoprotein-anchoring transpeptidase ErfK/SrfK